MVLDNNAMADVTKSMLEGLGAFSLSFSLPPLHFLLLVSVPPWNQSLLCTACVECAHYTEGDFFLLKKNLRKQ